MAPGSFGSEGTVVCLLGAAKGRQVLVGRIPHPAQELVLWVFQHTRSGPDRGKWFRASRAADHAVADSSAHSSVSGHRLTVF